MNYSTIENFILLLCDQFNFWFCTFQASRKVSKCGYLFVAPGYDFSNPLDKTRVSRLPVSGLSFILKKVPFYHQRIQRGGGGQGVQTPLPEKSQKHRISLQYWSGSPEESQSY